MLNKERILQLTRFCAVGGSVAVTDLTVVWVTGRLLPALVAVSLGYITGVTCHFLLNKFWVFRCNSRQYRRQLALYLLRVALYWLMAMLVVSLVLSIAAANVVVARMISIPPMMLFTFCFLLFVVFNKARLSPKPLRRDACSALSRERARPSFSPIPPKGDGWNARTPDHMTREELIPKYRGNPGVDVNRIEDLR